MPCTSACARRSATGFSRQRRSSTFFSPFLPLKRSAISSRRSVPSRRRLRTTSSTRSRRSASRSSYSGSAPALTMPMSMPAAIAWYRNTTWIACRTGSLPRKENDTLDTPPEMCDSGKRRLQFARGLDEVHRVVVVLLDAGGDREHVRVEDDVFRRKADLRGQQLVGARTDVDLALDRVGLALLRRRPSPPRPRRSGAPAAPGAGIRLRLPSSRSS